jgi:uncharacterized protein (DUF433 family)
MPVDLQIGVGAYTLQEIALFARMHPATVRRWFFGTNMGDPIVGGRDRGRFLTFLDFMQAVAVRNLRVECNVSLDAIRKALDYAKKEFGMEHPFAQQRVIFLEGKQILIQPPHMPAPIHAAGKQRGQHVLKPVLEPFLKDVGFDPSTGLASEYMVFPYKNRRVVMNPEVHFGQPFVDVAGITAQRLADAVVEEGGIEQAAQAFGVDVDDVAAAYHYIDTLRAA